MSERPQIKPATEGWKQKLGADGKPLLQFADVKKSLPATHWVDMSVEERIEAVKALGLPAFRAKQISTHYFTHYTSDPADMTDLPAAGREELIGKLLPPLLTELRRLQTDKGDTIKFLWKLHDGALVESVLMRYPGRITLCVSSQAGCGMNCPFCATGQAGLTRNMSAAEIVDQVVAANRAITRGELLGSKRKPGEDPERVTNIVFMGMGEPMDNLPNLLRALEVLTAYYGYAWSPRRITVSTIGVIPKMKIFLEHTKCHLAISMHSPFTDERLKIMPVEKPFPIAEVLAELKKHDFSHQRRVSFEYIMFDGFNDSMRHAVEMVRLLKGIDCRVNLIRFHAIPNVDLKTSNEDKMVFFRDYLTSNGITTTIRKSRGEDIFAACGMLSTLEKQKTKVETV